MRTIFSPTLKWALVTVVVIASVFLSWITFELIHVARPHNGASLEFRGFVLLPKGKFLTVLDYLTISDQRLFVTDETTGSVYKIALRGDALPQSNDVSSLSSEPAAHGVAFNLSRTLAYVTRSEVNAVDVFDPATMRAIARVPVAEDPDAIVFDPVHNVLYVGNGDAHLATLIDPESHAVIATIPLPGKPEFPVLDRRTGLMYQSLRNINSVAAVDIAGRSVRSRWPLPGCREPSGTAIDERGRRLFVVCAANAMLEVFDIDTQRVVTRLAIGGGPDSVAFDPELQRIYATGRSGVLTVIRQSNGDSYEVLDSIKVHYGAHTLVVDPATHDVYVGYASLLTPARVAVFAPRP